MSMNNKTREGKKKQKTFIYAVVRINNMTPPLKNTSVKLLELFRGISNHDLNVQPLASAGQSLNAG